MSTINDDEALLELRLREKLDPIAGFNPWPTQKRCYESKARYRWIGGGNRRGKSAELAIESAAVLLRRHPTRTVKKATTGLILAPSREQLQDPWEKKLLKDCELPGYEGRPLLPPWEIKKVYYTHGAGAPTIRQIDMKNGNIVRFGVSKDTESWKRRAGQQLAWIILDESEGNVSLLNELYPRLLDANKDPEIVAQAGGGWILWGATPTTANAALSKFIADCKDPKLTDWEAFELNDDDGNDDDRRERERLRPAFSDEDYELRMKGTTAFVDRLLIYAKHWDNAQIMRPNDYDIQPSDNIWCAYDPGGAGVESHDTGIMFAVINKEAPTKIRIVQYIRLNRTVLSYDFKRIAFWLRGRILEGFVPDIATNKTEKATGKTIRQQIREEMDRQGIKCYRGIVTPYNRHDPGIKRVQTYLSENLIEVNPSRESGGQIVRQQMLSYRSYEEGVFQGARGVVKKDDEACDTLRYLVCALNAGRTRLCYVPRGCGVAEWQTAERPPPAVEVVVPLTPDQANYQAQMERSIRQTAHLQRRRMRT